MNAINHELIVTEIVAPIRQDISKSADNEKYVGRLYSSFKLALKDDPDLLRCDREKLGVELLKAAADNLLIDGQEAALVPYKGTYKYQPMVAGIIKRVKELGGVFSITTEVVREKDEFSANNADLNDTTHKYNPGHSVNERGGIIAAYAIFRDIENRVIHREIMSKSELDLVRNASPTKGKVWKSWEEEMCKKSVIRRGAKRIPTDNDKLSELLTRMDSLFEMKDITPAEPQRTSLWAPNEEKPAETKATKDTPSAPDTPSEPSQGAPEAPEQQKQVDQLPPLDPTVAQEYSDHLWKSPRDFEELKIDSQQFHTANIKPFSYDDKLREKLTIIRDIHKMRISGKDAEASDARAFMELADLNIESPELKETQDAKNS